MGRKKGSLLACLVWILTSVLCLSLYHIDNKYTAKGTQPINGVLFREDDHLSYLTRQWILYPDVLLTPETVEDYSGRRIYTDIGGEDLSDMDTMTYQLVLILPEHTEEYALELPEVYSACRLYVNDSLALALGDPTPESYAEGLSHRVVPFSASGKTQLLLAVSDHSGVERGMTFPPAFGTVEAVLQAREGRMILHCAAVLIALLGAVLAMIFGVRADPGRGIGHVLLCLSAAVVTGYPLYHGLFTLPVQPWYTLEPVCYYGLLFLSLLLQCSICGLKRKGSLLLTGLCFVGLVITVVRFSAASVLPAVAAKVFSYVSDGMKYYTVACLLGLSIWAVYKGQYRSSLLLGGSTALACCLLWDRLLPLYEPIYGGWFGELGACILVISMTIALWLDTLDAYRFRLTYEESYQQMQQRLVMQKEHYSQLSQQVRLAREANHDLRHHMRLMRTMTEQKQWERLTSYLTEYESHLWEREVHVWSDHPVADAVLAFYAAAAKKLGAAYDVRFAVPMELPFPDDELCIVLSNLLENAVDALAQQQEGPRRLYLRGQAVDGHLGIVVDNTYDGDLREKDGIFLSTKHPGHGLGMSSVTTIAEKYGGLVDFSADEHVFHVSVFIPLSP